MEPLQENKSPQASKPPETVDPIQGPQPQPQGPPQDPPPGPQPPPQSMQQGTSLEKDIDETINLVKQEVRTSLSGMSKLPIPLFLILLGAGLAVLLGLLFFLVQLGGRHPLNAIVSLIVCLMFGALLVVAFAITRRKRTFGAVLSAVFSLVLIVAGGIGGMIGGLVGLCGVGIIFLKDFGILDK